MKTKFTKTVFITSIAFLSLNHAIKAQLPSLVKDITAGSTSTFGMAGGLLTAGNGIVFFPLSDPTNGKELWKSDGTDAGTVMIKDINPGTANAFGTYPVLANVNGTLFFGANNGTNGTELWKSDGTATGTVMVKDITAGSTGSNIAYLTNVNGTLFFVATDPTHGFELWKSDGTDAGTVLVKDIRVGTAHTNFYSFGSIGGTLFFCAPDENGSGRKIWKSNGTEAGTVLVSSTIDFGSGVIPAFEDVNGKAFIKCGNSLYVSDGTDAGTFLLKSFYLQPNVMKNINGTLYIDGSTANTGRELWKSDGTIAGTVQVKDLTVGTTGAEPESFINFNGSLLFKGPGGVWKSDGTDAGTVLVSNAIGGMGYPTLINGIVYCSAITLNGAELCKTDGTSAGTGEVMDIFPGTIGSSWPSDLTNVNGALFFVADNGTNGRELWKLGSPVITGINDQANKSNKFAVYPNPSSGLVKLSFREDYTETIQLKVIDVLGKVIYSEKISGAQANVELDLQNHPNGIYFLQVQHKNDLEIKKLILKR